MKEARARKPTLREKLQEILNKHNLERAGFLDEIAHLKRDRDRWKTDAERVAKEYERLQEVVARVRFAVELGMR